MLGELSLCWWLQGTRGAEHLQKGATQSASLQLMLLCCFRHHYLTPPCVGCSVWALLAHPGSYMLRLNVIWTWDMSLQLGCPVVPSLLLLTSCCFPHPHSTSLPPRLIPSYWHAGDAQARSWTQGQGSTRRLHYRWRQAELGPTGAAFHQLYALGPSTSFLSTPWLPLLAFQGLD